MKKVFTTILLLVTFCDLYAQNKIGGNVNSKESIAYADGSFLTGILDYDSLKSKPAPQNWPVPLDNTFRFTYVTGECRMIPSQFLFDAAEKLGVEKQFTYECEFHDNIKPYAKLAAIFIQKVQNEVYYRAFYIADDIVPSEVKTNNKFPWLYNTNPKSVFQKIYFSDGSQISTFFSTYGSQMIEGSSVVNYHKIYGNFDILDSNHFAFTTFLFKNFDISKIYHSKTTIYNKPKNRFTAVTYFDLANYSEIYSKSGSSVEDVLTCYADPLIEENYSRYSIVNMFDNNPSTSFVEDDADDNINLIFEFNYDKTKYSNISIDAIKMINGYAQSENLYYKNNRVKEFNISSNDITETVTLEESLYYQTIKLNFSAERDFEINTTQLYSGTKYNDTCIAELNFLLDGSWVLDFDK